MKYGALIGWGIVIYAVMYLAWSGMVINGATGGVLPRVVSLGVLIISATIAGRSLRFQHWNDILPYSAAWAVIAALLDAVYALPFSGVQMYADWNVWLGYALVVFIPLFAPLTRPRSDLNIS